MRVESSNINESSIITINEEIVYADELENRCSITSSLNKIISSNTKDVIAKGESYTTTLTPYSGYTIDTVTVTMNGIDVTANVYSDGVITIGSVTGDIVITATAISTTTYTNQLPISTDASGNVYNSKGWKEDTYLSSGNEGTRTGVYTTGFIPCSAMTNVYLQNVGFTDLADNSRLCLYDGDKVCLATIKATASDSHDTWFPEIDADGNITRIYMTNYKPTMAYIRLCCSYLGTDSIITVNEPIE